MMKNTKVITDQKLISPRISFELSSEQVVRITESIYKGEGVLIYWIY